ncbi:glycosyltransferase [Acetobacter musti]|uniref:Glycosyltransferase n=1 Tax=Acetobacter musti TaxID=864732 RepID=A0ABX0JVF2_9PROT|nr:glycosyltransferase [Acetobacter musti]
MKILHVVRQFSPSVGGLEDAVLSIARQQRNDAGLDAQVITLNRVFNNDDFLAPRDSVSGVPVIRIPWGGSTRYPIAPSVLWHLSGADIVHVHAIDFFFDYLALTRCLHRHPLVVSTHGGFFHSGAYSRLKKLWFSSITRTSIRAYSRIVACSENDAELFAPIAGVRLITIENGINQEKFSNAASVAPCRTLISFGRFSPHKRLDLLFPLLSSLRKRNREWKLIIAGRPAELTVEDLLAMARQAGVLSAVTFLPNPSDAELRRALGEASWFGCLSEHEGFGLAAVEAMSAGLIPVLSAIAPFRRLVARTGVGVLAKAGDLDETAGIIESLQADGALSVNRFRKQAIAGAQLYDWKDVAKRYIEVYQDVIRRHPVPPPGVVSAGVS